MFSAYKMMMNHFWNFKDLIMTIILKIHNLLFMIYFSLFAAVKFCAGIQRPCFGLQNDCFGENQPKIPDFIPIPNHRQCLQLSWIQAWFWKPPLGGGEIIAAILSVRFLKTFPEFVLLISSSQKNREPLKNILYIPWRPM